MTVTAKTYSHCPKKAAARQATILDPYRAIFGHSVPVDQQYWSMCASCADHRGVIEGSELHKILEAGLIHPYQFHGVDRDPSIFRENSKYLGSNWYCNDFLLAMQQSHAAGQFRPAIINADLIYMPPKGSQYIASILDFLDGAGLTDTIVIANIVLKSHNRFSNIAEIIKMLSESLTFQIIWNKGIWKVYGDEAYIYKGTDSEKGRSNTEMGTVVFVPAWRMPRC